MQQILLFPDHETAAPISSQRCYLALRAPEISGDALKALTPHLMYWEEGVWILDLSACLGYWQLRAQQAQQTLLQHLEQELQILFAQHASVEERTYTASFGYDPWWCILIMSLLDSKGLHGLFSPQSRMTQNLWTSLLWQEWWRLVILYTKHQGVKSQLTKILKSQRKMQLAMLRLGFQTPYDAKTIPMSQIRRRFGVDIADLWERTWTPPKPLLSKSEEQAFPWIPFASESPVKIQRSLDSLLSNWSDIEEFLRADLNRLTLLDSFKEDRSILSMEWRIVLYNFQEVPLTILFRHPHSLHKEAPHQRTALLQISYAFQNFFQKKGSRCEEPCWISGWDLTITSSWQKAKQSTCLFEAEMQQAENLIALENQIEKNLESYHVLCDWLPEDSFRCNNLTEAQTLSTEEHYSMSLLGRQRPLFLMKNPCLFTAEGESRLWRFRERTMDKWWQKHLSISNNTRDYYQVFSQDRLNWVFRNDRGQYFLHGIYG